MMKETTFNTLVENVEDVHNLTSTYAKGAVNQLLTVRNWMIGYYIVEYEQNGRERAEYGENLLSNLASKLQIKGMGSIVFLPVCFRKLVYAIDISSRGINMVLHRVL